MFYRQAEGTQPTQPLAMEVNGETVYIRKNIRQTVKKTEQGNVKMWSYDEAQLTVAEYMANQVAIANNLDAAKLGEETADTTAELLLDVAEMQEKQEELEDALAELLLSVVGE